jgi:hypothetical protein
MISKEKAKLERQLKELQEDEARMHREIQKFQKISEL